MTIQQFTEEALKLYASGKQVPPDDEFLEMVVKIRQLGELEEKFGISSLVWLSALLHGVYYRTEHGQIVWGIPGLHCSTLCPIPGNKVEWCFLVNDRFLLFNEYGKTWTVIKEDLA